MDEKLYRGWLTYRVSAFVNSASEWRWTAIFTNLHYWICLLFSLNVLAGTFTVVFLSWLRVKLAKAGFTLTYVIFSFVGLAMFLIPIIPGIPVYLTGGILLTDETSVHFFKNALSSSGESPSETKSYVCARLNRKVQNVIDEEYAIENGYHQDISDYDDDVKDDTDG